MIYEEIVVTTPNVQVGKNSAEGVAVHYTSVFDIESTLDWFSRPEAEASAYMLIGLDGTRYRYGSVHDRFWHAGISSLKGRGDCNSFLVGVEFVGNTFEKPLTADQMFSFGEWFWSIKVKMNWRVDDIVDHSFIAPGRKLDIGASHLFDLKTFVRSMMPITKLVPAGVHIDVGQDLVIKDYVIETVPEPDIPATKHRRVSGLFGTAVTVVGLLAKNLPEIVDIAGQYDNLLLGLLVASGTLLWKGIQGAEGPMQNPLKKK